MMSYIKAGLYFLAAVAGGCVVYFAFAVPRIDSLEAAAADATAKAQQEKAQFLKDAHDEQARLQSLVDSAAAQAASDRAARERATAAVAAANGRLRDAISAYENHGSGLPKAADSASGPNTTTSTEGVLVEQFAGYAQQCAAEADRLGDQVRGLLAVRGQP